MMRWWNGFVDAIEIVAPQLAPLFDNCVLFRFDGISHQVVHRQAASERLQGLNGAFRLPYPMIAIEDQASLIILGDLYEGQRGIAEPRLFAEFGMADDSVSREAFKDDLHTWLNCVDITQRNPRGSYTLAVGTMVPAPDPGNFDKWIIRSGGISHLFVGGSAMDGDIRWVMSDQKAALPNLAECLTSDILLDHFEVCARNAMAGLEEVLLLPALSAFTGWPAVPQDPLIGRLRRTHQRTTFRVAASGELERRPPDGQIL